MKINTLLSLVKGGSLPGLGAISWEAFGLPNIDRLLDQILGFGLHTIFEKKWPIMDARISAISTMMPVLQAGSREYADAFVTNGFQITIDTPIQDDQQRKEFDLDIRYLPYRRWAIWCPSTFPDSLGQILAPFIRKAAF